MLASEGAARTFKPSATPTPTSSEQVLPQGSMNTTFEDPPRRGQGVCAMRGGCGRKSPFDPELPCVDDGDANEVSSAQPSCLYPILSTIMLPGGQQ